MSSVEDNTGGGDKGGRRGPPFVPPEKRCTGCGRGTADGAAFTRCSGRKDGLQARCKECMSARFKARYHSDPEFRQRWLGYPRKWRAANPDLNRAIKRRWRDANRERVRATARQWRAANRDKVRGYKRQFYRAHRERLVAGMRAWRQAHLEHVRHRERAYYWRNADKKRASHRRWWALNRTGKPSPVRRARRALSFDDPGIGSGGKAGRSLLERTASASAPDPQELLLTRESQASALEWVETALSREEAEVLTAYADSGFDAPAAADLLGMGLADFERLLARVQRRAREEIKEN